MAASGLNYGFWDFWAPYDPAQGTFGTHKCAFDGLNKLIIVSSNVTALDIKVDVYSDWKEWVLAGNSQWETAIRTTGGDPTVSGQYSGDIYFLINGWKLQVDLTKVRVTGVLFSDDSDTAYYNYSNVPQYPVQVSSIVNVVETQVAGSGVTPQQVWEYGTRTLTEAIGTAPTAAEVATAVWDKQYADHNTAGTMGHLVNYIRIMEKYIHVDTDAVINGDGSQEFPYDNLTSAIDRAEEEGIRNIFVAGDVILPRNVRNLNILGIGVPEIDCNGARMKNTRLFQVRIKGEFSESIVAQDCTLVTGAYLDGFYENCALAGDLVCNNGANVFIKDCASSIPGTDRPTISMNQAGTSLLSVRGYNGGLTIKDSNQITDRVTVELTGGSLTYDASCTAGVMVARGVGKFVDQTTGATVVDETINREYLETLDVTATVDEAAIATAVWNYTQ